MSFQHHKSIQNGNFFYKFYIEINKSVKYLMIVFMNMSNLKKIRHIYVKFVRKELDQYDYDWYKMTFTQSKLFTKHNYIFDMFMKVRDHSCFFYLFLNILLELIGK